MLKEAAIVILNFEVCMIVNVNMSADHEAHHSVLLEAQQSTRHHHHSAAQQEGIQTAVEGRKLLPQGTGDIPHHRDKGRVD